MLSPQKVYRPTATTRALFLLPLVVGLGFGVMFLVLFFTFTKFDTATRIVFLIGAIILVALGVSVFLAAQQMRLVTSPQGVLLHSVGYKVYTPWNNIKEIGESWYGGNNRVGRAGQASRRVEGFIFYRPARVGLPLEEGIQQQSALIQGSILFAATTGGLINMLPLNGFLDETTRKELNEDAKKYAPDTFQATKDSFSNHASIFQNE
jgi:hypothetical protein